MNDSPNTNQTTFKDRMGTQWDVTLTFAGARRIDNSDFSILGIQDGFSILEPRRDVFNRLLGDTRLAVACVWAIVYPQAKEKMGIDPALEYDAAEAEFYDRLDGDVIKSAKDALWGTITNFFPDQRTVLSSLKTAYDSAQTKIAKQMTMMEDDMVKMLEEQVDKEMVNVRKELNKLRTTNVVGQTSSK